MFLYIFISLLTLSNLALFAMEKPAPSQTKRQDPQHFDFKGNSIPVTELIPDEVYGPWVKSSIISCVDVIIYNPATKKYFTVVRRDKPAQNCRFIVGGRRNHGESFFDTAIRKSLKEAGLTVIPICNLGTYSTHFPDSEWPKNSERKYDTHTDNTVVLAITTRQSKIDVNKDHEEPRWIPIEINFLDHDTYSIESESGHRSVPPYMNYPQDAFIKAKMVLEAYSNEIMELYQNPDAIFEITVEGAIRRLEQRTPLNTISRIATEIRHRRSSSMPYNCFGSASKQYK